MKIEWNDVADERKSFVAYDGSFSAIIYPRASGWSHKYKIGAGCWIHGVIYDREKEALDAAKQAIKVYLRNCWATPDNFWKVIKDIWKPTIDVSATKTNAKCQSFICPEANGLEQDWSCINGRHMAWCNPPFSNAPEWLEKAHAEMLKGVASLVLSHEATSAAWAYEWIQKASAVWMLTPRIPFMAPPGIAQTSNPRGSMLLVFDPCITRPPGTPTPIYHFDWKRYLAELDAKEGK